MPEHPWFLACQFHPEFKSKPYEAHPIFRSFIAAAIDYHTERLEEKENREGVAEDAVIENEVADSVEADVFSEAVEDVAKVVEEAPETLEPFAKPLV